MSIIIIEPECKGWNHEQVNIAWIKMIKKIFPEEKITFWAEENHLRAVKKKTGDLGIEFHVCELPNEAGDSMRYVQHYKELFSGIFEQEAREQQSKILLLSSHKGNLKAILQLVDIWEKCEFYIVLHAVVEQLIKKYSFNARIRGGKFYDGWMFGRIMNQLASKKNVKFATFSPALTKSLQGYLQERTLEKICFVHHPYDYESMESRESDGIINIGVMGATVNHYSLQIMEEVGLRAPNDKYRFTIIRSEQDFSKIRNIHLVHEGKPILREEMDIECRKMDYMLIPYDKSMYRLSASGVFFDSINYEIVPLMLDSPLLTFYEEKYSLGKCHSDIEDLIDDIVGKIELGVEISRKEQEKIRCVKAQLQNENKQYIRKFMNV